MPLNFAVAKEGVYFAASRNPLRSFEIRFYSLQSGRTEVVTSIERGLGNGMVLSPDGKSLLFTTMELNSGDLFVIEGFR